MRKVGALRARQATLHPIHELAATVGALGELRTVLDPFQPAFDRLRPAARQLTAKLNSGGHYATEPAGDGGNTPVGTRRLQEAAGQRSGRVTTLVSGLRQPVNLVLLVLLVGVLSVWWVGFRPTVLGGPASYIVVRGDSMEPTLNTGDLVLARSQPTYSVGELVIYAVPRGQIGAGDTVIHRIVGGSKAAGYVLKGDKNPTPDPWTVPAANILGKATTVVPGAGRLLLVLHTPLFAGLIAALIAGWLVMRPPDWMRRIEGKVGSARDTAPHPTLPRALAPAPQPLPQKPPGRSPAAELEPRRASPG